jgi:hypothetical protein
MVTTLGSRDVDAGGNTLWPISTACERENCFPETRRPRPNPSGRVEHYLRKGTPIKAGNNSFPPISRHTVPEFMYSERRMTNDLERYYELARPGSLACVQRADQVYGDQYIFTRVLESSAGRIKTQYGTFWAVNGERIDKRWHGDDNRLVLPTITRVEAEEANLPSLYQFGTDRKFELAAARAILERRSTKMPEVPPPPVPNLEEAEAELRDATTYWMSVDQSFDSPSNSVRARREASERLAAAKTNFCLAKKMYVANPKLLMEPDVGRKPPHNEIHAVEHNNNSSIGYDSTRNSFRSSRNFGSNSANSARYTFSLSTIISIKGD